MLHHDVCYTMTYVTLLIFSHEWKGTWRQVPGSEKHLAEVNLQHTKKLLGFNILSMSVVALQVGPSIVYLTFQTALGKGVMLQ